MTTGKTGSMEPCVCPEQFQAMKRRFRDVGDCLTDQQLLELADCYHEILRWRRSLRFRHPLPAAQTDRRPAEPVSFAANDPAECWGAAHDPFADHAPRRDPDLNVE